MPRRCVMQRLCAGSGDRAGAELGFYFPQHFDRPVEHVNARTGTDGLHLALTADYDLVVLDVMLPGLNGWGVVRKLREHKSTPVLFLSARDELDDRVQGLELGGDDFYALSFWYGACFVGFFSQIFRSTFSINTRNGPNRMRSAHAPGRRVGPSGPGAR